MPPAAIVPVENAGEYPRFSISGKAARANIAAVAVDDPQIDAERRAAADSGIGNPPRRWPSTAAAAL